MRCRASIGVAAILTSGGLLAALGAPAAAGEELERLPDFSGAGYHAGEREPPRLEPRFDVRAFGAVGDGRADDTGALGRAIAAAVEAGGGVVGIPEGRWVLRGVLTLDADGVVVQGAGAGRTVLVCPEPLAELVGESRSHSWSGGLLRVQPRRGPTEAVARLPEPLPEGADALPIELLEGAAPPRPGEWLELLLYNDTGADTLLDAMYGGVIARERMGAELREAAGPRVRAWVQVTAVEAGRVTIAPPLRLGARPAWRPLLRRRPHVREVGIEGLTFAFPDVPYPGHLKERGYNAIAVRQAIDCWVRDVETENADSGIFLSGTARVTVDGFRARGRRMHHAVSVTWGTDNLVTRFWIEAPHVHGTTVSWSAHRNVFSEGGGAGLAMDAHRAASFENLHTAITVDHGARQVNPLRSGGARPRGPHAARAQVYWNVRHLLPPGEGPAVFGPYPEWPRGVFAGWHGTREVHVRAAPGLEQRLLHLDEEPPIPNLHLHQRRTRR